MKGTRSSTAQDLARDKHTEIDSLNGYVARLGAKLGVPTPVNHTLYTLVKLYEPRIRRVGAAIIGLQGAFTRCSGPLNGMWTMASRATGWPSFVAG